MTFDEWKKWYDLDPDLEEIAETAWLTAQAQPSWIPCSERLPEVGVEVLTLLSPIWPHQWRVMALTITDGIGVWKHCGGSIEVSAPTHWQPLPAPPKTI
jgi:hypothetical protein